MNTAMRQWARARWWVWAMVSLLACSGAVSLGLWQLSRAAQKNALHASMLERTAGTAIGLAEIESFRDPSSLYYRPALIRGEWLGDKTVFLDNRQMQDRVGFYVVTPLRLSSGKVLLVYRGWVARNFLDRQALPAVDVPSAGVAIPGTIAPEPGKLYEFGEPAQGTIRQNLDIALFRAETHLDLLPFVLMQTADAEGVSSDGLQRQWPVISTGVEKHYGYAVQWFAIATVIAAVYLWFQLLQPYFRRTKESAPHVP